MTAALPRTVQARTLPVGTTVTVTGSDVPGFQTNPTVLVRRDKPGRCPWQVGNRWVATWRVQDLINDGAQVDRPAQAGVKRR